ncbi:phospholipid scramblase 1-like isoform X1 [Rattus norvegicus]|nr:phospholipid scramblase 1-like [Rattus norvegicus]XP_006243606.1 phospholipid scramblase 2 isoform X1 [Rattus norvegicus]XP_008764689.1 phospholipid scramblase 2 isoform X1 [Rattus norvegicus]XP_017451606.1 phospholipid scramblase 2 isoform X1 [Rattus norvegicus]|eukprot:XP_006243606.1 PREDICTED: phospholipid scramblase 1-like isoform X1 [Rattus norvegicus]
MDLSTTSYESPPGLEYLLQIDHILIHQQFEFVEAILGFETANQYKIKDKLGQKVYYAIEDSNFLTRNCCGDNRPFSMRIIDNSGHEVITLQRPLRCDSCFCPCCLQKMEVQAPPGVPIGYIIQTWHPCRPKFTVQNEEKQDVLKIIGPIITCSFGGNVDFEIKSLDEAFVVGRISKHWSGFLKEILTDVDSFGIQFPLDLDVKIKAVMLGACFLIDFMFFESSRGQRPKLRLW